MQAGGALFNTELSTFCVRAWSTRDFLQKKWASQVQRHMGPGSGLKTLQDKPEMTIQSVGLHWCKVRIRSLLFTSYGAKQQKVVSVKPFE